MTLDSYGIATDFDAVEADLPFRLHVAVTV